MNAWQIIREHFTAGKTPNSTGHMMAMNDAAKLYVALRNHLGYIQQKDADKDFNTDKELRRSLLLTGKLEALKKLL